MSTPHPQPAQSHHFLLPPFLLPPFLPPDLVIRRSTHRKLKAHTPSSQLSINLPISVQPVIHPTLLLLIKNDLQHFTSIFLGPNPLADNLNRIDDIGQDGIMHRSQGTGARSFLSLRGPATVGAFGTGENASGSEDENVAVGEFLFELACETLLDFMEAGE
jgi:hypothetical protein